MLRPQRATSMADVARDAHVVGCSAWRRRNRRLRAFWRHEQQAVRMAVAAATHRSYNRSSAHACTQTDLVPQKVDNVLDALRLLDLQIAEQVIDVPKISCSPCPSRCPIPEPQSAEQLVEVPTVLSPTRIALRIAEQIVDILASARGVSGSLQGFPTEQSSAQRTASQIVDIPVPGRGVFGSPQGSLPVQSTAMRTASQIADIPVPGRGGSGCLLGSLPEQRTTALHVSQKRISERIVEQFDAGGDFPSPSCRSPETEFSSCWCRAARQHCFFWRSSRFLPGQVSAASPGPVHVDMHLPDSAEWVELYNDTGRTYFWNRRSNLTVWQPPAGLQVVWVGEKDEDGDVWYWHRCTRASGCSLPPLPPE